MSVSNAVEVHVEEELPFAVVGADSVVGPAARATLRRHPVLWLLGLSLLLLLPMLLWGLPITGDDSASHLRWQYFYGRQMWSGDPFPRWIRDIADGFGSPAFFIYPPLPHFVAALLTPMSDSIAWLHRRLAIAITLASFVGALGAFTWFRQLARERNVALIGAMMYTLAPYHMFVDTYFRTAYSELWGLAWAPFAFAGMHLLLSRRRAGLALAILGLSGLLLSHAPSALILAPLALVYAGVLASMQRRWDILVWGGIAFFNAVLIAGLYLATALGQQVYIHTDALYTGYYNFYNWLMFASNPVSKRAFDLSALAQGGLTLMLAGAAWSTLPRQDDGRRLALATMIGTCILSLMMTRFSFPIWKLLPFLQKIQFPWRLQTAQTVLLALSSVLFLRAPKPSLTDRLARDKWDTSSWLNALPLVVAVLVNLVMAMHAPSKFGMQGLADTLETPEYTLGDPIADARRFAGHDKLTVAEGKATLELLRWDARHIAFRIDAASTTDVLARQFTFTGWTCRAYGTGQPCRMVSSKTGDVVRVQVGPGAQRVDLVMPQTIQERAGKLASLAGLLLAALMIYVAGRRPRQTDAALKAPAA